MDKQYFCSS